MSTALEAASLIMIPNSYSDGLLASVKPNDGTGDFTFTRGSDLAATRVNADGYIEKGYENLLLQSNQFDTTWTNYLSTETSGQIGYDGNSNAWLLIKSGASGQIRQNVTSSGVATFSVYAKANASDYIQIVCGSLYQFFNLSLGTLGAGIGIGASIEAIGTNGWYRCSMSFNSSITSVRIYPSENNTVSGTSGNILIQDAMLNQGLVALPYVESGATKGKGGVLENTPRIDFTSGTPSLLLEPSRTNSVPLSEYYEGTGYLLETSATLDSTLYQSPEGVNNAYKLNLPSNLSRITHAVQYNGVHTFSVWMKADTNGTISLRCATGNPAVSEQKNVTTEWQRFDITATDGHYWQVIRNSGDTLSSVYMYGYQIEAGSYPTSYIPTYGVSQTRAGDVLGNSNDISGLFSSNQGTLYFETNDTIFKGIVSNYNFFGLTESSSNNYFRFRGANSSILAQAGGFSTIISFNPNGATFTKYLYKWDGTNAKLFIDGVERGSASQTATFNPDLFRIGFNFGFVSNTKQLLVFPTALTDSECIELTTV
mgnify:CR=1 FL=1